MHHPALDSFALCALLIVVASVVSFFVGKTFGRKTKQPRDKQGRFTPEDQSVE